MRSVEFLTYAWLSERAKGKMLWIKKDSPQRVGRGPFKKLLGNLTFETSYVVVLQARTSKGWGESSRETTRTIKRMGE